MAARAPDDPLPTNYISKVVKLTNSWPMHLNINRLIFCNPGNVKGYLTLSDATDSVRVLFF